VEEKTRRSDHFAARPPLKILDERDAGVGGTRGKLLLILHREAVFAPIDLGGTGPFVPGRLEGREQPPHYGMLGRKVPVVGKVAIPPVIQEIGDNH
jgi:hypothetical protein